MSLRKEIEKIDSGITKKIRVMAEKKVKTNIHKAINAELLSIKSQINKALNEDYRQSRGEG